MECRVKLLSGKKIVILGVANERSIAWGITEALHNAGAELAFTYVNEAIEKRLRPLATQIGCERIYPCDVQSDAEIENLKKSLESSWGSIDGIVHSIAFAEKDDMGARFSKTSRAGFHLAMDVSAYSLVGVCGALEPLMRENGGSVLTLSYLGSERVVPNYNVMGVAKAALESSVRYLAHDLGESGIRVNAISAGPIKTLAASGIPQFKQMLASFADTAPLKRNVSQEEVGNTALFYMSNLSSAITGEVTYVDCGFNVMGM
jgi:enoyl-[acyl-carrier protein] reductase I